MARGLNTAFGCVLWGGATLPRRKWHFFSVPTKERLLVTIDFSSKVHIV